jgi:hypothetical protein
MSKNSPDNKVISFTWNIIRALAFVCGGFLIFRSRKKIASFVKNQNFIITAAYAMVIAFIALFYRLIMVLNWIIQQGH